MTEIVMILFSEFIAFMGLIPLITAIADDEK